MGGDGSGGDGGYNGGDGNVGSRDNDGGVYVLMAIVYAPKYLVRVDVSVLLPRTILHPHGVLSRNFVSPRVATLANHQPLPHPLGAQVCGWPVVIRNLHIFYRSNISRCVGNGVRGRMGVVRVGGGDCMSESRVR